MKTQVLSYNYNREHIKPGILHIGVGNFHRAHEEFYTNLLLEDPTQQDWGICGAMLLPGDERLYRILEKQKKEYTLTICGRDVNPEKPDVPLNKNDAFQKVQKRRVQEKR